MAASDTLEPAAPERVASDTLEPAAPELAASDTLEPAAPEPTTPEIAVSPQRLAVSDPVREPAAGRAQVATAEVPRAVDLVPVVPEAAPTPTAERDTERPEPEEPEPTEDETRHMLKFVRVDEPAASSEPPEDPEYISARDASHDVRSRAPVTEPDPGRRTPHEIGLSTLASSPSLLAVEGNPTDPMGERPEVSEEVAQSTSGESGGGRKAHDLGAGAPGEGGDRREGGQAAPRSGQSPSSGAPAGRSDRTGGPPVDGYPEAPEPDAVADVEAPEWWSPMASRMVASPDPAPEVRITSPSSGDAVALVRSSGMSSDRGGTAAEADETALPTEAETPTEVTGRHERAGASDPVADLRDALGWGGTDRTALQPRAAHAGARRFEGAAPSSPQAVVDEEVDLGRITWVEATETPLGHYTERVHEVIGELWRSQDLDPDERARGIQGDVTVSFIVARNGRVSNLGLVKSSGHPDLDRIALHSVPRRLPRFPRDVHLQSVLQRITFHYRNPLIVAELQ